MDLPVGESYEEIRRKFSWQIPEYFNIADAVCDRWADDTARIAITHESLDGSITQFTFSEIKRYANQLANLLRSLGVGRSCARTTYAIAGVCYLSPCLLQIRRRFPFGLGALWA